MAKKEPVPTARQDREKPIPAAVVGSCGFCGVDVFDGVPMTCCLRGALGYVECVLARMVESDTSC